MNKNYYEILGISEDSTAAEIKSAFRKLARKYHPDIAGSSNESVAKFKEINEAYELLSNIKEREEYDRLRHFYNYSSTAKTEKNKNNATNPSSNSSTKETNSAASGKKCGFSFNWEEFISKYKEMDNRGKENKSDSKGKDISTEIEITIAEAANGVSKVINMLRTQVCPKCKGRKFVNGATCPHCQGKGETTVYKKFTVKIPAGVKNNSRIRLAGEGEKSLNGGNNGDLYITIHIKSALDYIIEGLNVIKTVSLTPSEAVLGGNISIIAFNNEHISVKISPNTRNGQKIRLSGCGINDGRKTGDMILKVEIQIPKNLSKEEIQLYKKLQELSSSSAVR